jgi:hypothetical protein
VETQATSIGKTGLLFQGQSYLLFVPPRSDQPALGFLSAPKVSSKVKWPEREPTTRFHCYRSPPRFAIDLFVNFRLIWVFLVLNHGYRMPDVRCHFIATSRLRESKFFKQIFTMVILGRSAGGT